MQKQIYTIPDSDYNPAYLFKIAGHPEGLYYIMGVTLKLSVSILVKNYIHVNTGPVESLQCLQ